MSDYALIPIYRSRGFSYEGLDMTYGILCLFLGQRFLPLKVLISNIIFLLYCTVYAGNLFEVVTFKDSCLYMFGCARSTDELIGS